jgi:hypothetical protein
MNDLPNEPEAIADALIAAFTRRSDDHTFVLPTQLPEELSESELEAQPSVVMQAGSPTYASLPLAAAPQQLINNFALPEVVAAIANMDAFDVARLRSVQAPWPDGQLVLLPHRDGKIEVPFFAYSQGIGLAGRTNEWIYKLMAQGQQPKADANLPSFVRIFFATIVGRIGAFRFADRMEDAMWLPEASEGSKREFAEKLSPLRLIGTAEDGRLELRGSVIFKNALFSTSVMVASDWQLELTDEELLLEDLPVAFGPKIDLLVRR